MTGVRQLNDDLGTRTSEIIERLHVSRGTGRMLVLLVVAFVFFATLRPSIFLSSLNLQNLALAAPEIGVLAIAMMLAMLTGGIDLSLVNIANLSAITMSTLYTTIHESNPALAEQLMPVLILAGLGMGLLGGVINAVLVAYVGITPILATLGTMQIFNGIAVVWTGGRTLYGSPAALTNLGQATVAGIPILFLVFVLAAVLVALLINRTPIGLKIQLEGSNPMAAAYSG
ncbi:MAG: ABC transporter permease, partial [Mycobacterium sp.]